MKSTSRKKDRPRGMAGAIPVFCAFDAILPAADLTLWHELPDTKNPQVHSEAQLDRYELVIAGDGKRPGNGYRRAAVRSTLSGAITKGNGLVMMARRRGWSVPIEDQAYTSRREEIRDVTADNEIARLAERDLDALQALIGELDPGEIQFTGVSLEEWRDLLSQADEQLLADVDVPAPPKMAWALIGIPLTRFGEISPQIEACAKVAGVFVETTPSDREPDGQKN